MLAKKRIFSIEANIPNTNVEDIPFESDTSLDDADIILYRPSFGIQFMFSGERYNGLPILSQDSSYRTYSRIRHWKSEIAASINSGKLIVVFLDKPVEYYRYTGERKYSGTGRSRVTTNVVTSISSYDAIPLVQRAEAKTGERMELNSSYPILKPYWAALAHLHKYRCAFEGDFDSLITSRAANKTVGGIHEHNGGAMLLLPMHAFGEDEYYTENDEGEEIWNERAFQIGHQLISEICSIADALKSENAKTPPPDWSKLDDFRLEKERKIEFEINAKAELIQQTRNEIFGLEKDLSEAGKIRGVLYEQGTPLELAIIECLKAFGFQADQFEDDSSEFDAVFKSAEGRCLGEAEGKDKTHINISKFQQLERNILEDLGRDDVEEPAKAVLFGNAFRLSAPGDRGSFFTEKCMQAAVRTGTALVRTPDLFAPAQYLLEHPEDTEFAKKCRTVIFDTRGDVVAFPTPPKSRPKRKKSTS